MPDMSDTLHVRCAPELKLQMQAAAKKAGMTDGDFIRDAVIAKIKQVNEQEIDQNDRTEPVSNSEPIE